MAPFELVAFSQSPSLLFRGDGQFDRNPFAADGDPRLGWGFSSVGQRIHRPAMAESHQGEKDQGSASPLHRGTSVLLGGLVEFEVDHAFLHVRAKLLDQSRFELSHAFPGDAELLAHIGQGTRFIL